MLLNQSSQILLWLTDKRQLKEDREKVKTEKRANIAWVSRKCAGAVLALLWLGESEAARGLISQAH